jgi:sec-independent protein translocase protein TatB
VFEMSLAEMAVIAIVALLVLGPERLPKAARTVGFYVRKARQSWYSVRSEFERELAAEELKRSLKLDEVHATLQQTASSVREGLALEQPAPTPAQPGAIDQDGLSAEERARQSEALNEPLMMDSPEAAETHAPVQGVPAAVAASSAAESPTPAETAPIVKPGTEPGTGPDAGRHEHSPAVPR